LRTKPKTRLVAEVSLFNFIRRWWPHVYFWTFSEPGRKEGEPLWSKDEAEAHFKPFRDLVRRMGYQMIVIWERQKRGSWHPHCLISGFFDVNFLRVWMMERGWGQQMFVERVNDCPYNDGHGWRSSGSGHSTRIIHYLTKYLTKSFTAPSDLKKKIFSATHASKAGSTKFSWMATERAGAYLYAHGRSLFLQLYGCLPTFKDMACVIRLGVEETGWADVDFLWMFAFR
jgi:hypothetical protein